MVLPCGERGRTWHMNDGSHGISWREVRPFWRTRRKMMGTRTGQMKVLNMLDPCSRNTQPKALGQGLLRWSYLLRWKWGGCGKRAQERWAAQLRGVFRQKKKKKSRFLVLPAEFTILRQKIKLSHKNNGPSLHAVLCRLPSPPQSLITTLAGSKADGTSLCYRWGNWGSEVLSDLLKVTRLSCRAVTINQLASIQN